MDKEPNKQTKAKTKTYNKASEYDIAIFAFLQAGQ
jgi:hypothetical protein